MTTSTEIENVDYKDRVFSDNITAEREPSAGPGWYIFARNSEGICKLIARPNVPARKHPHYTLRVRRGWLTKKEAEALIPTIENLILERDYF